MKYDSIRKHRVRPGHVKHFNRWLARDKAIRTAARTSDNATASPRSSNNNDVPHINDDNGHLDTNTNVDDDPIEQEIYNAAAVNVGPDPSQEESRTLIDMWTQDHTSIFKTPPLSVNSSQDTPIGIGRNHDHSSEGSETESTEDPPLVIDTDESSWAPFSSLEVCLCLRVNTACTAF